MSPNKHQLRGPGGKYVSASEKARRLEEGIFSESKSKVLKVQSEDEDGDLERYHESDGKPVRVDVDKESTGSSQKEPTLTLLPNK